MDDNLAHVLWVLLLPIVWATLGEKKDQQVNLARPVIALIGKGYHERQVNMRPNVVQVRAWVLQERSAPTGVRCVVHVRMACWINTRCIRWLCMVGCTAEFGSNEHPQQPAALSSTSQISYNFRV